MDPNTGYGRDIAKRSLPGGFHVHRFQPIPVLPRTRIEVPTRKSRRGKMWKARLEDLNVILRPPKGADISRVQRSGESNAQRTRSACDSGWNAENAPCAPNPQRDPHNFP